MKNLADLADLVDIADMCPTMLVAANQYTIIIRE